MYFTMEGSCSSIESERGMSPQGSGAYKKEAVSMLKKFLEFIEEYYEEFSHSEKW